jgi:hypothetical protein
MMRFRAARVTLVLARMRGLRRAWSLGCKKNLHSIAGSGPLQPTLAGREKPHRASDGALGGCGCQTPLPAPLRDRALSTEACPFSASPGLVAGSNPAGRRGSAPARCALRRSRRLSRAGQAPDSGFSQLELGAVDVRRDRPVQLAEGAADDARARMRLGNVGRGGSSETKRAGSTRWRSASEPAGDALAGAPITSAHGAARGHQNLPIGMSDIRAAVTNVDERRRSDAAHRQIYSRRRSTSQSALRGASTGVLQVFRRRSRRPPILSNLVSRNQEGRST